MYNITKWQYITILVFGVFMWIYTILAFLNGGAETRDIRRISPIYETAQILLNEGKYNKAREIVDNLSKRDYGIYTYLKQYRKTMKKSDKMRLSVSEQLRMMPTVAGILFIFIPSVLVFYTIGWRNYRKKNLSKNKND